jgi:hypothetical protein
MKIQLVKIRKMRAIEPIEIMPAKMRKTNVSIA